MDMEVQKVISWLQDNVGDRVSKTELVQKAQDSDLPMEAKSALRDLPEGEHSKDIIISTLKDKLMAGVGGGMGGMFGRGG
ncbi:MAG: hypothetical protein ACYC6J_09070 [Coriobacteriia bacterium]